MPPKLFQRRREDFSCLNCGTPVTGTGYTNHCPRCLYSRHVDVNPGDRAALLTCGGLMPPVGLQVKKGHKIILHRCQKCGHQRPNKASPADDPEALIRLSALH